MMYVLILHIHVVPDIVSFVAELHQTSTINVTWKV